MKGVRLQVSINFVLHIKKINIYIYITNHFQFIWSTSRETSVKWPHLLTTGKCALLQAVSVTFLSISGVIVTISTQIFALSSSNGLSLVGVQFALEIAS